MTYPSKNAAAMPVNDLQRKSDALFAACLQYLIGKEEQYLATIASLAKELSERGYETSFEHKRRALIVREIFSHLQVLAVTQEDLDKVGPRVDDVQSLPEDQA